MVVHGHERIPNGMYYLMLSRAQTLDQIYISMPKMKNKPGELPLTIKANFHSLQENKKLVERSIVPNFEKDHFCVFMVNIASIKNKLIDIRNDIYAQKSDHICLVETWLDTNTDNKSLHIPGRYDFLQV